MHWVSMAATAVAATAMAAAGGAQAQTDQTAAPANAPTTEAAADPTPNEPSPTPLAADLRSNPTQASAAGVTRYDPPFFADARPNTAMDMIDRIPGFSFDDGDDVRGFAGAAGNVLVDGARPTSKQDNLESILRRIPASQVDHIDLIRGGAPGIDMQGKTVLVNVVRKSGGGNTGLLAFSNNWITRDGRNRKAVRAEGTRRWDGKLLEGSFVVGQFVDDGAGDGPRVRTDINGDLINKSDQETEASGVQRIATAAFETPLAGGKFRINGSILSQPFDYIEDDTLIAPTPGVGYYLIDTQERTEGELGVRYERNFGARTTFESLFIQQLKDETYSSDFQAPGSEEFFIQENQSSETIGRATLRYRFNDKLSAELGAEAALNSLDTHSQFTSNGAPVPLPAGQVTVEEKRGELSGKLIWKPTKTLNLEVGIRAENSTISSSGDVNLEKTLFYPKPRAALTWSPNEANQIRFRVEREVGQLDFGDFAANGSLSTGAVQVGNPDIVPQQAWLVEAAYERRFWKNGSVVVTYRHSQISDAIDRVPIFVINDPLDPIDDEVFDAPGNIGDGTQDEVQLALTLPLDRLWIKNGLIRFDGTFRESEVTDPTTGEKRRISGQHRFDYEAHFSQDLPKLKSNWGIDVYNRWSETYYRYNEIASYNLKTWAILYFEYKPQPDLSLRTEISNLGSRGFERIIQRYSGPRNTSPLAYVDRRDLDFGPMVYFRVRKTFGG